MSTAKLASIEKAGDAFFGAGSTCTESSCDFQGACCLNDGSCVEVSDDECDFFGGTYSGGRCEDVECSNFACPADAP